MRKAKSGAVLYMNIRPMETVKGSLSERAGLVTEENGKLPDYRIYKMNRGEILTVIGAGSLGIMILAWLFYRELLMSLLFSPLLVFFLKREAERRKEKRKRQLAGEFRDGMQALASALRAGYSVENAFAQAERELTRIYGSEGLLSREFTLIQRQLHMNETVETALTDLAERSGLEDIREMAQVFAIAKRSGGRLPEILQKAAESLEEKGRMEAEIQTLMAAKRLEQRLMCLMPAAILAYVGVNSPDFLAPLYQGLGGRVIMTVCLIVYGFAVWLGERIMKIGVV